MNRERKTSYKMYSAWNYKKEEMDINENAKNGWQLVKGGCFHSIYEKDDSKKYVYKIDYNPETMKNSPDKQRYISMFEELGWEYINSTYNGWSYFRKEFNENSDASEYEIYTDHASYSEMLNKWCKLGRGCLIIMLVCSLLYAYLAIRERSILLAVEDLIFWVMLLWIKKGLDIMNERIEDK
ncbi:DUF2812 domain-containing protein [Terrisporobacter sp.]